jgi:hypothetical protein
MGMNVVFVLGDVEEYGWWLMGDGVVCSAE